MSADTQLAVKATPQTVAKMLVEYESQIAAALPKHLSGDKAARMVLTQIRLNPKLQECTALSLMGSVVRAALQGVELDGEQAALVPFYNGKLRSFEAQYQPMYKGIIKRTRNSGEIGVIIPRVVRKGDHFERWTDEKGDHFKHVVQSDIGDEVLGAYMLACWKDKSGNHFEYMTAKEIEAIRLKAPSQRLWEKGKPAGASPVPIGVWADHFEEQCKKTVLKRGGKVLPLDSEVVQMIADAERADLGIPQNNASLLGVDTMQLDPDKEIHAEDPPDNGGKASRSEQMADNSQGETSTKPQEPAAKPETAPPATEAAAADETAPPSKEPTEPPKITPDQGEEFRKLYQSEIKRIAPQLQGGAKQSATKNLLGFIKDQMNVSDLWDIPLDEFDAAKEQLKIWMDSFELAQEPQGDLGLGGEE